MEPFKTAALLLFFFQFKIYSATITPQINCDKNATTERGQSYGIVGEKTTVCACVDHISDEIILEFPTPIENVYGYEMVTKKFTLPSKVMIHPSDIHEKEFCIHLVFGKIGKYVIAATLTQGGIRLDTSFSVTVLPLSELMVHHYSNDMAGAPIKALRKKKIYFMAAMCMLSDILLFQWEFGDGTFWKTEPRNRRFAVTSHAYKDPDSYSVIFTSIYLSKTGRWKCFANRFTVNVVNETNFLQLSKCLDGDIHRIKSSYSWELWENGEKEGGGLTSNREEPIQSICFLKKDKNSKNNDFLSKLRSKTAQQTLPDSTILSVSLTLYYKSKIVIGLVFTMIVTVDPVSSYNYQWSTSSNGIFLSSQAGNTAKFGSAYPAYITVKVSNSIDYKVASYYAIPENPFGQFSVIYSSSHMFKYGTEVTVAVNSTGLERSTIKYELYCEDQLFDWGYRTAKTTYLKATFSLYGILRCILNATLVGHPTPLYMFTAPGVYPVNTQYITSRNVMNFLVFDIMYQGRNVKYKELRTKEFFELLVVCDAVGTRLTIKLQDKTYERFPQWYQSSGVARTVFYLSSQRTGTYNLYINANNLVSMITRNYAATFIDAITTFSINPPPYIVAGKTAHFTLSQHNGTAVTYKWTIDSNVVGTRIDEHYYEHILTQAGLTDILVTAINKVSSFVTFVTVTVYEDLKGFSWGDPPPLQHITTNESFPINVTFDSGLPVLLAINIEGSGTTITKMLQPRTYNVFHHAFDKPGCYDIDLTASNHAGTQLNVSHSMCAEEPVKGLTIEWTRNYTNFCVPSNIDILGIARVGTSVFCNISIGDVIFHHEKAHIGDSSKPISCSSTHNLVSLGFQKYTLSMYNSVSSGNVSTGQIFGKSPSQDTFELHIAVQDPIARFNTESLIKIEGNFECPLLNCNVDYGDGSSLRSNQVLNGSIFIHKYNSSGEYNITGTCSSHKDTKEAKTQAIIIDPLIITETISEDNCFPEGEPYIFETRFKFVTSKTWRIKLNDSVVENLTEIVFDRGNTAIVNISSELYGGYGNTTFEVSISDALEEKIFQKLICARFRTDEISVTVKKACRPMEYVEFFIKVGNPSGTVKVTINFGDSMSTESPFLTTSLHKVGKTYSSVGNYQWRWTASGDGATGSGLIKVMNPVLSSYEYEFSDIFMKFWPDNEARFWVQRKCGYADPTEAIYRILIGDGSCTGWLPLPPLLSCYRPVLLLAHRYERSGCYEAYIEMKNLLGYCGSFTQVNIFERFTSISLEIQSIPRMPPVEKVEDGVLVTYLRKNEDFKAIANVTGGRCRRFEWTVSYIGGSGFWFRTSNWRNWVDVNALHGKTGTFEMKAGVTNDFYYLDVRKRIFVTSPVSGLALLASDPDRNGKVVYYVLVQETGTGATFTWYFQGDTGMLERNPVFTAATNLPGISVVKETKDLQLWRYVGFTKNHTFDTDGVHKVDIVAKDSFLTLRSSKTVYVSRRVCKRPIVTILLEGGKSKLTFSVQEQFTIVTDLYIECDDSSQAEFAWTLYLSTADAMRNNRLAESDKIINFPAGVVTNQREITLPKLGLAPGIYKLKLEVTMKDLGYSGADEAFLELSEVPLYVRIVGGSTRVFSWDEDIFLDGYPSFDPNIFEGNPRDFHYQWLCNIKPGSLPFVIGKGGCFGYGNLVVESREYNWTVPANSFTPDGIYNVTLFVRSKELRYRTGKFEQHLDIRKGAVIKTAIECNSNCKGKLDPVTRLSLTGKCDDCEMRLTYNWTLLVKSDLREVPLRWLSDTRTPQNSISFVLLPGILQKSVKYLARFTAIPSFGRPSYTDYPVELSTLPYGGFCNVTPPAGEAVKTSFFIACYDWKSDDNSLRFSISLIKNSVVVGALTDNSESTLLSYGAVPHTKSSLPEGLAASNYEQVLEFRIINSYGAATKTTKTVQVRPFVVEKKPDQPDTSDSPLETELEGYVLGKNSTLERLIGKGDLQGLGRFAKTIGKTLDTAKEESSQADVSEDVKEKRKLKRKNMREKIVNSLTEIQLTNLDNFALINSALEGVSVVEDEIGKGTQDKMLNFYDSGAKFMEERYSIWQERDPKMVQDAFGSFLQGVGNMLESAVLVRNDSKGQEKDNYLKFTGNTLEIIENTTALLFRSIVANEIAKRINSASISVEIQKSEEEKLNSMQMKTLNGGIVQTPSGRAFLGENGTNTEVIQTKMVSLARNPYTWDKGARSKIMTRTITSVKFMSNGTEVPVKYLPPGDELMIEMATPNNTYVNKKEALLPGKFHIYRLELPAKWVSLMLRTRCYGTACRVYIRTGGIPSRTHYNESYEVSNNNSSDHDIKFKLFQNMTSTTFNIGVIAITAEPKNMSAIDNMTLHLEIFTTGCFYWEEDEEEWKSDGCKLSDRTTPFKTICYCNHLTWFGAGLVVMPNLIDISDEVLKIKDLADYPALLATVCVVGGLYLIAMVWARRQDRNDIKKAGLIIVDDCCRTHKHRYDVTIYTGSRPGSGTTSSVYIILGGKYGESDPHCLSLNMEVLFQRGSVDSFLVTSAEDLGKITCIRLWHDSTGASPSWFLSRIVVTDIVDGMQTTFICHTWLGIGIGDGHIDKTFIAAEENELKDFETLFLAKTSRGFSDDHLWFSIAMKPPRSNFSRCQRISCCLSALLCTMLANAMFYQVDPTAGTQVKLGSFSFSWNQIAIGVEAALIVIPINLLIVTLFRKAAPSVQYDVINEEERPDAVEEVPSKTNVLENEDGSNDIVGLDALKNRMSKELKTETNISSLARIATKNNSFVDAMSMDTLDLLQTLNEMENDKSNTLHFIKSLTTSKVFNEDSKARSSENPILRVALNNGKISSMQMHKQSIDMERKTHDLDVASINGYNGGWLSQEDVVIDIENESLLDTAVCGEDLSIDAMDFAHYLNTDQHLLEAEMSPDVEKTVKENIKDLLLKKSKQEGSKKKKEVVTFWPHWCFYVGWVFCSLSTVAAGFFTLLYGLSFGRVMQEEWLVSFFTSIFQDIFVSQPTKVIVIGCVFAFILKKLTDDEKLPEVELAKNNDWVQSHLPLQEKRATGSRIKIPLTGSYVQKAHINRLKEIKMTDVTLEIIVYFFYIFLALLIAYGHRAPTAYRMGNNIRNMFITDKFDQIHDVNGFWKWVDDCFLPSTYGEVWYNGQPTEHKGFLADYVTYLIGSPRLRQIRVIGEKCPVSGSEYDTGRDKCGSIFSGSNEDKDDYSRGWTRNGSVSDNFAGMANREDPWKYYSAAELKGHIFVSRINSYSGGGFVRTLGKTLAEANSTFTYLKEHLWLDTLTRALFIEFSAYNNNENFYCIVTLVLEFNADGGISPYSKVITTRLDRYSSDFSLFLAACEISFLLLTLYYMWLELKVFRKKGFSYFRQWSSLIEVFTFSVTWATFGLLIVRMGVVKWTKKKYKENPDGFISFQYAASSDLAYGYTLAAVVVIAFLKVLKIFRFNKNMLILLKTLQYASDGLKCYSAFFTIALGAFIQWAHLCFGRQLPGYATFVRTCMSVLNLLLGSPQFYDLRKANRIIGPIFFILFIVLVTFVLMNLFLSIIMDAFAKVRREMKGQPNKYDILEFVYQRITTFLPFLKQLKKFDSQAKQVPEEVEGYYERRLRRRKGEDSHHNNVATLMKKMDRIENVINKLMLSEYESIDELARCALKVRSSTMQHDFEDYFLYDDDDEDDDANAENVDGIHAVDNFDQ